jgi:eukaryotic-like serine/threonine-protein kinase
MEQTRLSHYRIMERLGAGGMGEVYLAEDTRLGRKVALKLLSKDHTAHQDRLRRFEQEASAASVLNHPNILVVHEIGDESGQHFIATEYVDGDTLRRKIAGGGLSIADSLDIAIQVASALEEAHGAGIIHRDIKPENIMVRRNGLVKVLDFGLAKLTEKATEQALSDPEAATVMLVQTDAGVVMGTSQYMSPEQARGKPVDGRTDIWSLGVLLYEMVAGRVPFEGETPTDVIVAITQKEPPPLARFAPDIPKEFEWIVDKALRKDRDERYQTIRELLTDLRRLRQRLEFEAELERSTAPEDRNTTVISRASGMSEGAATGEQPRHVTAVTHMSSAEYIITEIRRHKKGFAAAVGIIIVAIGVALFFYLRRAEALTTRDTVLLADFVNTTGEPVFDGTLTQALAVQLGQSPFLNIFPDDRVHETLRYMGRSPDERITREIGREICERQGIKALLLGSISSLGSHYVITLEALNAHTGDALAREQVEADGKEKVLSSLGQAASRLRRKLGESLSSIQKFDVPIEQATTSSLEALKAYSAGDEQRAQGNHLQALPFYKRAVELDQNFAMAYARLAVLYGNQGQQDVAEQYAEKAYELRDRVSERERFYILEKYYTYVSGEIDKVIETLEAWERTYPNDYIPHNNLFLQYSLTGRYENALKEIREAVRLSPENLTPRGNMASAFIKLDRYDEAQAVLEQMRAQSPDTVQVHALAFQLAFLREDHPVMEKEIAWCKGGPYDGDMVAQMAGVAGYRGQLRLAAELTQQAAALFKAQDRGENAANAWSYLGLMQMLAGRCPLANQSAATALSFSRSKSPAGNAAVVFAGCGDFGKARALLDELGKKYAKDSTLNAVFLPVTQAVRDLDQNNFEQAVRGLEPLRRYEIGDLTGFWSCYLRGEAYRRQNSIPQAQAEFRNILGHRGLDPASILYPLAQLQLARAAAAGGDGTTSRKAYQDFFSLWKDADADLPILIAAKAEYEKVKLERSQSNN